MAVKPTDKLILQFRRAPGDVLMMTGLVRDLKLQYPRIEVDVRTQFPGIWLHNPYLTPLNPADKGVTVLELGGKSAGAFDRLGIRWSKGGQTGRKMHYATIFHRAFSERTGLTVVPTAPHGDLHLSDEERKSPFVQPPYWIIVPGGKTDMTNKWWVHERYQETVDRLRLWGLRLLQDGATKPGHVHPPLNGVFNIVGRSNVRDAIVNIYHAEGVICGCTFQMHIAGALNQPCVVLLGGREEPWYEAYGNDWQAFGPRATPVLTPHRVLHTLGQLDCCRHGGCWLRRVERIADGQPYNNSLCRRPTSVGEQRVPECMAMISTDQVVDAVLSYYYDGTLSPPSGTALARDVEKLREAGHVCSI